MARRTGRTLVGTLQRELGNARVVEPRRWRECVERVTSVARAIRDGVESTAVRIRVAARARCRHRVEMERCDTNARGDERRVGARSIRLAVAGDAWRRPMRALERIAGRRVAGSVHRRRAEGACGVTAGAWWRRGASCPPNVRVGVTIGARRFRWPDGDVRGPGSDLGA
jgi:hypothetical protein